MLFKNNYNSNWKKLLGFKNLQKKSEKYFCYFFFILNHSLHISALLLRSYYQRCNYLCFWMFKFTRIGFCLLWRAKIQSLFGHWVKREIFEQGRVMMQEIILLILYQLLGQLFFYYQWIEHLLYIYLPSMYSIKYKNEQLLTDTDM